jgi:hypothetical protein
MSMAAIAFRVGANHCCHAAGRFRFSSIEIAAREWRQFLAQRLWAVSVLVWRGRPFAMTS